jgi:hypothetical protein
MPQGILPFKYKVENKQTGMTALAGLPAYLDLAQAAGLRGSVEKHVGARRESSQGWTDSQIVMSLVLLNLAGGDCVDDLRSLETDEGLCRVMRQVEHHGLPRQQRRELERRHRKSRERTFPSPSPVFRYLKKFHDPEAVKNRPSGKAFIPAANEHLAGLSAVNRDLLSFQQRNKPCAMATIDMDATLVATSKEEALYGYKGYSCYQPLNSWWAEQGLVLHTEFRDGNVPAGFEQRRVFEAALNCLPEGVKKVRLRSDTAGYQHELLRYCEQGENERFDRIEFAICCDVTKEFKQAAAEVAAEQWRPLHVERQGQLVDSGTQWAEVCFVPNRLGTSKNSPVYRYLALRTALPDQPSLPGVEEVAPQLPFPTMEIERKKYKLFGLVSNMDWDGERLIHWQHERCGKSEEAHAAMKEDLAGGKLPSGDFGANAAWWWIMILAHNLNAMMKSLALDADWQPKRMKAIRFRLINLPGMVVERARELFIRLSERHPGLELLLGIRRKIMALTPI